MKYDIDVNDDTSSRSCLFDIAKGLAIITIIVFHTGFLPLQHVFLPLILPWMVPLFPIIAGYIYARKHFITIDISNKLRSIIGPYVVFGIFSYLGWLYLRTAYPFDTPLTLPIVQTIRQLIFGQALIFNGPLWFLPPYMSMYIFITLLFNIVSPEQNLHLVLAACFLLLFGIAINPMHIKFPYSIDIGCMFTGFFLSGFLMQRFDRRYAIGMLGVFIACIFFLCTTYINGVSVLFDRQYNNPLLYIVTAILGSWIILKVSFFLSRFKGAIIYCISYAGHHSLIFFSIHWPLMQWLTLLLFNIGLMKYIQGTPNHVTFYFHIPNSIQFTSIELISLIVYTVSVYLAVKILKRLKRIVSIVS